MPRTAKENGIFEGKVLTRLNSIDKKLNDIEKVVETVQQNKIEIAKLKTQWKIILTLSVSIVLTIIAFIINKI